MEGAHSGYDCRPLTNQVSLTAYTARYAGCHPPTNWRVEGTNEGDCWSTIFEHTDDEAFLDRSHGSIPVSIALLLRIDCIAAHWQISNILNTAGFYRRFRWIAAPGECLHIGCLELYGTVATDPFRPVGPASQRRLRNTRSQD